VLEFGKRLDKVDVVAEVLRNFGRAAVQEVFENDEGLVLFVSIGGEGG
jgi:hypothetical protein